MRKQSGRAELYGLLILTNWNVNERAESLPENRPTFNLN